MNKTFWVALTILVVIGAMVAILSTGGSDSAGSGDATGDVVLSEGPDDPQDVTIADIAASEVRREGKEVIFEVEVASELPAEIPGGSLEFRWDLSENGTDTWIISATLNVDATAAVTSQRTSYGSSTIDGTLPGAIVIEGDLLRVTLKSDQIKRFPDTFTWRLSSTLDGNRTDPASATATDTAPDSGSGEVSG